MIALQHPACPAGHRHGAGLQRILSVALTTAALWRERRRQRQQLLALGDHMLKDLGITRADAVGEGSKPFWQA